MKKSPPRSDARPRLLSRDQLQVATGGELGNAEYGDFNVTVGMSQRGSRG